MHVTGKVEHDLPESALKRLVSLYVVQTLEEPFIDEVYNNLVDCYLWSTKSRNIDERPAPQQILGSKRGLRITKAKPVTIEE
jgi:hypothetical protein